MYEQLKMNKQDKRGLWLKKNEKTVLMISFKQTKADWEMADSFKKSFSLIVHYLPAEKAAV